MTLTASHPDIDLPESVLVEIGTAFTAAVPEAAEGWTFNGWYTDRQYQNKWVDGTIITGDLDLFGKWTEDSEETGTVSFAYSSNSEITTDELPSSITWPVNTKIYPSDLPELPTPAANTTTITGWYIDLEATELIDSNGVVVPESGLTLYAKAESSDILSVSFAYSLGRLFDESDPNYPMPQTSTAAWDAEMLGDDSTLPDAQLTGSAGETITLPTAAEMEPLFEGTDFEAQFKGWYTSEVATGNPVTSVTLNEDTTVYALYEPVTEHEFIDITYKVANVYVPSVAEDGTISADTTNTISAENAAALMPALPAEYTGSNTSNSDDVDIANYEWHDKVLRGTTYRLKLPQNATERTGNYVFAGYFADIDCTMPLDQVIEAAIADLTVYCKFVPKSEVVLPNDNLPETYNITFKVDGFAEDTDLPSGGLMPPDMLFPAATYHQPVDIDETAFPGLIDAYIPEEMAACEGFDFKGFYYYDDNGTKVEFEPGVTDVQSDLVLYPEFEILDSIASEAPVMLVEMTPDTLGAPEELSWMDVPSMPFAGIINPQIVTIGSSFNTATVTFPNLEDTFEVEGFYKLENVNGAYVMQEFKAGKITEATTLFVRFRSTIDEPLDVIYTMEDTSEEATLIAPDFDYELAASSATDSGGFSYEPRPADIFSREDAGVEATSAITGYYTDPEFNTLFDPENVDTEAGDQIEIYPKVEETDEIMVTVDYIPNVYNLTGSHFKFEIPSAPELAVSSVTGTTYLFPASDATRNDTTETIGYDILNVIGPPPTQQFWWPKYHEYGNCYWYTVASDESQTPRPFNPEGFTLTEPICLYPQFEADMDFPTEATISFAYSSNSTDTSAELPVNIPWTAGTYVYPGVLPKLPAAAVTTVITGWYLDAAATELIPDSGVLVPESGLTLYAKAIAGDQTVIRRDDLNLTLSEARSAAAAAAASSTTN